MSADNSKRGSSASSVNPLWCTEIGDDLNADSRTGELCHLGNTPRIILKNKDDGVKDLRLELEVAFMGITFNKMRSNVALLQCMLNCLNQSKRPSALAHFWHRCENITMKSILPIVQLH